jgi:regulator of replication initiation timing
MKGKNSQVEKNVSASFSYVKKDILMLNDNFTELHNKFQQFLSQYDLLLDEFKGLKDSLNKKPVTKKTPTKKKTIKKKISKKKKPTKKKLSLDYELLRE